MDQCDSPKKSVCNVSLSLFGSGCCRITAVTINNVRAKLNGFPYKLRDKKVGFKTNVFYVLALTKYSEYVHLNLHRIR